MLKPTLWSTTFSAFGAALLGLGLFHLKHTVERQERLLNQAYQHIQQTQESIHILKAEWAYLTERGRLEKLSGRHLKLKPLDPRQMVRIEDIPLRTPVKGGAR